MLSRLRFSIARISHSPSNWQLDFALKDGKIRAQLIRTRAIDDRIVRMENPKWRARVLYRISVAAHVFVQPPRFLRNCSR